jgi:hypothetical protein
MVGSMFFDTLSPLRAQTENDQRRSNEDMPDGKK